MIRRKPARRGQAGGGREAAGGRRTWLHDPNWTAAGRAVRAGTVVLGCCGLAALAVQVVSLAVPASRGWSTSLAWALAGTVAAISTITAGLRVHIRRVTRESWILWGAGAGCWAVGIVMAAPAGPRPGLAADIWFLALPVLGVFTYFRRVPRAFLFLLFLLDASPVVLLIVALVLDLGRTYDGVVYTALFTGLYMLLAANAIQMIGLHRDLRHVTRTWLFTLAFCLVGLASLTGPPNALDGQPAALAAGALWTLGLLLLGLAALGRILNPTGFVQLLPTEKQTGPHAIPPTVAVFGLIVLLVITPRPSDLLRYFLVSAALVLIFRIILVYRQGARLIAEVVASRERLHRLAEVAPHLRSLVLDELLRTFCQAARDVLGVPYAAFGLAGPDPAGSRMAVSCAARQEAAGGPGQARQPAGETLRPDRVVRLSEPTRDPVAAGFRAGRALPEGFLAMPVRVGGTGGGVLYLAGRPGGFTADDENLAGLLAASCGYAIVNAELYAQARAQQDQLAAQNERLRELDQLKDEFVALVSHELRTPLTSIIGYVELLKDEDVRAPDSDHQQFADIIDRNARRLLRLVGDLLFLSRIQSGQMEMEISSAGLGEIATRTVEEAQPRARGKNIELVLSAAPLPALSCDPERITQVLDNLVTNAIKFTPTGGRVAVTLGPAGDGVSIEVSDTGMGISGPDQQRIFDTFFRSETAVKRAIPGTGLGLTITKAIVDAHHGRITVDSREGGGTTFRVWLPRQQPWPGRAEGPRRRLD
ncbi:MAG: ATP-binding protein [Gemmatimonadota bacterium]